MSAIAMSKSKKGNYAGATMFNFGLKLWTISSFVPTTSLGIRLTRYAPARTAILLVVDMPERFERIDPASEAPDPGSRKRGGGAKSRAVKVPDLRSI